MAEAETIGLLDTEFRKAAEAVRFTRLPIAPFRDTTLWPGLDTAAEAFPGRVAGRPAVGGPAGRPHAVVAWGYDPSGDTV